MLKKAVYFLVLLLISVSCYGATLQGDVYDLSLEKISDVVIEVDSSPIQRIISTQGEYELELPIGEFTITAKQMQDSLVVAEAEEKIVIADDGNYNLDLFLFPNFEVEESIIKDTENAIDEDYFKTTNYLLLIVIFLLLFLIGILLYLYYKPKVKHAIKKEVHCGDDLDTIISIINAQGGRTTQKEIRKHIPLSEAKVSLMITELESAGKIRKIKKGRGNIIILNK